MILLCDFDEYNMNESNMKVLFGWFVFGKDEKVRYIFSFIENYFMFMVFDWLIVVGIYIYIEFKLEFIREMWEFINIREIFKDLEK